MDADVIRALQSFLGYTIRIFGPAGTLRIGLGVVVVLALRRFYLDREARQKTEEALREKERSIQRLTNQEREWRLYFMIRDGMTPDDAERIILRNVFDTPQEARSFFENPWGFLRPRRPRAEPS